MSMHRKSKKTFALICLIPFLIGIAVSLISIILFAKVHYEIDTNRLTGNVNTVLGIWGSVLGFIITAESILVGFSGGQRTKEIMESRHYKTVLFTYTFTCLVLLISLIIFITISIIGTFNVCILGIFIACLVVTAIYIILCIFYLALMVITSFIGEDNKDTELKQLKDISNKLDNIKRNIDSKK